MPTQPQMLYLAALNLFVSAEYNLCKTNTFCWIDIPVLNLDRAIELYADIQKIAEHGFEFGLLPHTENNVSGCLTPMPDPLSVIPLYQQHST